MADTTPPTPPGFTALTNKKGHNIYHSQTGKSILETKVWLNDNGKPQVSYVGDERFDRCVEFAKQCKEAVASGDATKFPADVDPKIANAILNTTNPLQQDLLDIIFQKKLFQENGPVVPTDLALVNFSKKMSEVSGKSASELKELASKDPKAFDKILINVQKTLSPEEIEYLSKLEPKFAPNVKFEEALNFSEFSKSMGKNSKNPGNNFACRHYAPELGAMWAAYGEDVTVFDCLTSDNPLLSHVVVLHENTKNISDPTTNYGFSYRITDHISYDVNSTNHKGGVFYTYNKAGHIEAYFNIDQSGNPGLKTDIAESLLNLKTLTPASQLQELIKTDPGKAALLFGAALRDISPNEQPISEELDFSVSPAQLRKTPEPPTARKSQLKVNN